MTDRTPLFPVSLHGIHKQGLSHWTGRQCEYSVQLMWNIIKELTLALRFKEDDTTAHAPYHLFFLEQITTGKK